MASSFADQIPVIVYLPQRSAPATMLDVGKGLGKHGFLAHEYTGISYDTRPDPSKMVASQSRLRIDAVEAETTFLWPHLSQFYRKVYVGRIEDLYLKLPQYDVVLMADVIEHLRSEDARAIVKHFLDVGSKVIISTPKTHFEQYLFESQFEEHLSHWRAEDFRMANFNLVNFAQGTEYDRHHSGRCS